MWAETWSFSAVALYWDQFRAYDGRVTNKYFPSERIPQLIVVPEILSSTFFVMVLAISSAPNAPYPLVLLVDFCFSLKISPFVMKNFLVLWTEFILVVSETTAFFTHYVAVVFILDFSTGPWASSAQCCSCFCLLNSWHILGTYSYSITVCWMIE